MHDRSLTIDCLRGIAVIAVILQHCLEFSPLNNANAAITEPVSFVFSNGFNLGRFGVIVFFLISGYLIPSSLGRGDRPVASFVAGRFFRLYPMYWVSIGLALLLASVFGFPAVGLRQLLGNMTMFQMAVGIENILDPYWTLFIELLFYIGCVILFVFCVLHDSRSMRIVIFLLAGLLMLLSTWIVAIPDSGYSRHAANLVTVGSYLFIMLLGHAIRQKGDSGSTGFPWSQVLLFAVVFVFVAGAREAGTYNRLLAPASVFFSSFGALLFFLAALRFHFVENGVLELAGRISYGMYLLHGLALLVGFHFLGEPSGWWSCVQLLVLVLALTWVSAWLGFYLVENPGIRIGATVRRSLGRGAKIAVPTRLPD